MNATTAGPAEKPLADYRLLELLTLIFGDGSMEVLEPSTNKKRTEVARGTLTSERARRLYSAYMSLVKAMNRKIVAFAESGDQSEQDKREHIAELEDLNYRSDLLFELFTAAIFTDLPLGIFNPLLLRAGWTLVSEGETWETNPSPLLPNSLAATYVDTLADVLLGKRTFEGEKFTLAKIPKEGRVVGIIQEPELRSLSLLIHMLEKDAGREVPKDNFDEWFRGLKIGEAENIMHRKDFNSRLAELTRKISGAILRQSFPELRENCFIIAEGWQVVIIPHVHHEHSILMMDDEVIDQKSPLGQMLMGMINRARREAV